MNTRKIFINTTHNTVNVISICFCHRQAINEEKKRAFCDKSSGKTKSHKRLDNFLTKIFGKTCVRAKKFSYRPTKKYRHEIIVVHHTHMCSVRLCDIILIYIIDN